VILRRVWHDPVLRSLPIWLVTVALAASAIEGVRTLRAFKAARAATDDPLNLLLLVLAMWLPLSVFLFVGKTRQRCRRFDMALPVPARELWLSHMLAVVIAGGIVAVAAAAVVTLRDSMIGRLPGSPPVPEPGVLHVLLPLAGVWLLAVAMLQSPWPKLYRIPVTTIGVLLASVGASVALGLIVLLASVSSIWSLIPLALAILVILHGYRNVPAAFVLVQLEPERGDSRPSSKAERRDAPAESWDETHREAPSTGFRAAWSRQLVVLRIFSTGELRGLYRLPAGNLIMTLFATPLIALWGFFMAGGVFSDDYLWNSSIILTAYLLLAFIVGPTQRLHLLDPLPISRRRIFASLVLPILATLTIGVVVGRSVLVAREGSHRLVEFQREDSHYFPPWTTKVDTLRIPFEFCAISGDGDVPQIESPWGESHDPWKVALFGSSGAVLYSPFSPRGEASPEFIALQISRAIEAIYGESVPYEEILERYLEIDDAGAAHLKAQGRPLQRGVDGLVAPPRIHIDPLLLSLSATIYLLAASVYFRAFRAQLSDAFRKGVWIGLLVTMLGLHVLQFVFTAADLMEPRAPTALLEILVRQNVGAGLGAATVVWSIALLMFFAAYGFALRQFQRIEVPLAPAKAQE
jgi:hypothetical protein